jgi:hypothetical protein
MLELEEEVALVVLALQKRRKRRSRRVWVHPIFSARITHSSFYTLYIELREDDKVLITSECQLHHLMSCTIL